MIVVIYHFTMPEIFHFSGLILFPYLPIRPCLELPAQTDASVGLSTSVRGDQARPFVTETNN